MRAGLSLRRSGSALAVLLGALICVLLPAPAASAHAYVIATTPSNGAQVDVAPAQVQITFDEPVTLPAASGAATVIDSFGATAGNGSVRLTGGRRTLLIGLRTHLAKGSYIASWSVVSADTHPVGGSIQFGYGVAAVAAAPSAAEQPSAVLQLLAGIVKGLLYLGLVAALGLLPAALVLDADPGERRIVRAAAWIGAVLSILASILQIVTQYLWDASAVVGGAGWHGLYVFAGSGYAETIFVRIGLLVALLLARTLLPARPTLRVRWLHVPWAVEAALGVAVLAAVVRNGHGGTGAWWYFISTLVHVCAVVGWLGGLAVLGGLVLRARLPVHRLLRLPVWSRYAATSVGLLALTGLLQAVVQVRRPAALISTTYGYILIVKLVLVAGAFLLGLLGNRWIGRQLGAGLVAPGQTRRLRGRVRAEAGIGAAIVVVSGVLSSAPPAATAYAPSRLISTAIGPYAVTIEVAPARRGPQSFRITTLAHTGSTAPAQSVQLDLAQAASGVRALPVGFPYRLPGAILVGEPTRFTFVSSSVNVPDPGVWRGTLTLIAGPTEQYVADFTYRVL